MKSLRIISCYCLCCTVWTNTPFPFRIPKGFPRRFTGFRIIREQNRVSNWAENYFMKENYRKTGIFPVPPAISSLLLLQLMNTGSVMDLIISSAFGMHRVCSTWPGKKKCTGTAVSIILEVQPLAPLLDPHEMAEDLNQVHQQIKKR